MEKPKVLFAIGDVEWKYTQGKLCALVERVKANGDWEVVVASHMKEICDAFTPLKVKTIYLPGENIRHLPEHAIAMTDLMIRLTQDINFPGSRFPIWKAIAMDDYLGCLDLWQPSELPMQPDLLVYPLVGIDNSTASSSHFYTTMALEAKKVQAPIMGIEISPLGNRQTFAAALADYYAVKTEFSRSFLIEQGIASAERVFILPPEEGYLLTCRGDPILDELVRQDIRIKPRQSGPERPLIIFIPHNVAFVFEIREILKSLAKLRHPAKILLNVTASVARHSLKEKEIAEKSYREELRSLPNLVINEEEGWLWTLLFSDVAWGPVCSVYSELASSYGKLTIVSQTFGEKKWLGENLFLEPDPNQAIRLIESWAEQRLWHRRDLSSMVAIALKGNSTMQEEARDGA